MNLNFASNRMEKLKIKKIKCLLTICTAVLVGCHSRVSNTNNNTASTAIKANTAPVPVKKDTLPAKTAVVMYGDEDSGYIEDMGDTTIIPKKIHYNLYNFKSVSIGEPFSSDSALIKLYPGNYYKLWRNDSDSVVFEAWSCKACPVRKFTGWAYEDMFPLRDSNETLIADTVLLTDSAGNKSIIISFGTTAFDEDFLRTGRLAGAIMGLALFTEVNNRWQLKAFNPGVGDYGMFQTLPEIHPFKFNKNNFGCYFGENEQGGGGPVYISAYVFGVFGNTFKKILEIPNVCRTNRARNQWNANMDIDSSQMSKPFPDLVFTIYGDYSMADFGEDDMDDTADALPAIKKIIKHKDNFDFTIKSRYTFSGNQYKFVKEGVTTSPHKEYTNEKGFRPHW